MSFASKSSFSSALLFKVRYFSFVIVNVSMAFRMSFVYIIVTINIYIVAFFQCYMDEKRVGFGCFQGWGNYRASVLPMIIHSHSTKSLFRRELVSVGWKNPILSQSNTWLISWFLRGLSILGVWRGYLYSLLAKSL